MEQKKWSVSYSQYSMWENCPLQWKFKYIDNLEEFNVNIHNIFGSAMHNVIQHWLKEYVYSDKSESVIQHIDLSEMLRDSLIEEAKPHMILEDGSFLFSREDIEEFYCQGITILKYIQANYKKFFPTSDTELFAIEYQLSMELKELLNFKGYIDVVTKTGNLYKLYDLKTSTKGWNRYKKAEKKTTNQLLLYKKFFSDQENVPMENIDIEFLILKRTIDTTFDFPVPRISKFTPPHGKPSISKTLKRFDQFINECFSESGERISDKIVATPGRDNCRFCVHNQTCEFSFYKK